MTLLKGIELSPCIVSKARFALKIKQIPSSNSTHCSYRYWVKVINHLSDIHNIDRDTRDQTLNDWK